MKITRNLPRFSGRRALLIVLGKQVEKTYLAYEGQIEERDGFTVETPKFSDRESFFQSSGRGQVYASGSVHESQEDYIISTFTSRLAVHLRRQIKEFAPDDIYLFMPAQLKALAKVHMSKPERALVRAEFYGNYVDFHPFTLLTMIKEEEEADRKRKEVKPLSKEADKMLRKKDILDDSEPAAE